MNMFDDAPEIDAPAVSGKWMPIRLTPDMVTGEILNIGIVFIDGVGKSHTKLLESAHIFRCAYAAQAAENLEFLLRVAHEHFSSGLISSPSPHITLGNQASAAGSSAAAVLKQLFATMVTLRPELDDPELSEKSTTINTLLLRKQVFGKLKLGYQGAFKKLYREVPVSLEDGAGKRHTLDLPLWSEQRGLIRPTIKYGTVVSAQFKDEVYRGYSLSSATTNIMEAHDLINGSADGGIFILRPTESTKGYSEGILRLIDNDIDRAQWAISRHTKHVSFEVCSTIDQIAHKVAEFASL